MDTAAGDTVVSYPEFHPIHMFSNVRTIGVMEPVLIPLLEYKVLKINDRKNAISLSYGKVSL
jgi:hypothetical protein